MAESYRIDLQRDRLLNWIFDLRDEARRRADRVRWNHLAERLIENWMAGRG